MENQEQPKKKKNPYNKFSYTTRIENVRAVHQEILADLNHYRLQVQKLERKLDTLQESTEDLTNNHSKVEALVKANEYLSSENTRLQQEMEQHKDALARLSEALQMSEQKIHYFKRIIALS